MSFIDKILDKMSLNSEDDEEFDNEDYYLDDEEEEELPRNPFRRKKEAVEEETAIHHNIKYCSVEFVFITIFYPFMISIFAKYYISCRYTNIKIIQKAGSIRHGSLRNKTKFN